MNLPLFIAGLLAVLLGIGHSVIGEQMIFRGLNERLARSEGRPVLSEQQVRVLRATWHLLTLFGFALAFVLLGSAIPDLVLDPVLVVGVAMVLGAAYWLPATRGRHPAWIVLLIIAALCFWGR